MSVRLPGDPEAWAPALGGCVDQLKQAVDKLGAAGVRAAVLYRSPTQATSLRSIQASPDEAREAASLACFESLPYAAEIAVCRTAIVCSDPCGKHGQQHVGVAADRNDVIAAIARLVDDAGLRFDLAVPIDMLIMAAQVREVLRPQQTGARLYIGEHSSFFLVCDESRLVFARQIRIGLDAIGSSLTLPIQRRGESEAVQLDSTTARRILHERGLPGRDELVHEQLGLTGGQVIPLMQPVLQRLVIELRQSLRFGLSDSQRDELKILLTGPGSSLPGFGKLIGDELGVPVGVDDTRGAHDWAEPAGRGSQLGDAWTDRNLTAQLGLLSNDLSRERNTKRLCRWMWGGAAAAIVLIGVDVARYQLKLQDARRHVDALETQTMGQEQLRQSTGRLTAVSKAMKALRNDIKREVGAKSHYGGILKEISRLTPPEISLSSVSLLHRERATIGRINGIASAAGQAEAPDLQAYIDTLSHSPFIEEIALENVQIGTVDGGPGQIFEASFTCLLVPDTAGAGSDALAVAEEQP
ncbi:MAG: hypothetical protein ACYTJ0_06870 [Planctomycetota bacterium]